MNDEPVMTPEQAEAAEASALPPILDTYQVRVTVRAPKGNVKPPTLARVEQAIQMVIADLVEGDGLDDFVIHATAEHV